MKQSAVEWLIKQIMSSNIETYHELYERFEKAKEMEAEQSKAITLQNQSESKAIPELSDEEIKILAENTIPKPHDDIHSISIFLIRKDWLMEGMKAYREQLKQRQ